MRSTLGKRYLLLKSRNSTIKMTFRKILMYKLIYSISLYEYFLYFWIPWVVSRCEYNAKTTRGHTFRQRLLYIHMDQTLYLTSHCATALGHLASFLPLDYPMLFFVVFLKVAWNLHGKSITSQNLSLERFFLDII